MIWVVFRVPWTDFKKVWAHLKALTSCFFVFEVCGHCWSEYLSKSSHNITKFPIFYYIFPSGFCIIVCILSGIFNYCPKGLLCRGASDLDVCASHRASVRPSVRPSVPLFFGPFLERQNADTTRETLQKGSRKWSIFAHTLIWGSNWYIATCDGSEDRDITSFQ